MRHGIFLESVRSVRPILAPLAGELMPSQGQLDETLPVGTFGCHGALHCRLGFMLGIVLGTHEANSSRPIWTSGWQIRPYDCGVNTHLTRICDARSRSRMPKDRRDDHGANGAIVSGHPPHEALRPGLIQTVL
ncbi:hypothetical protein [Bradyrhizobium sp. 21]|uniref:hypothetical protein n=1 Tax=Bradyrhizobium sp. 21 TaxID=2782666 RepID=UPI001FFAD496|nr:hypothetical protein [Bradyrhizobium sp. 21]MCK1388130.1 hypothetical protein [Bradyrhizobium sp. 21]